MDKNLTLDFKIKGQLSLNAQVVPLQEGYLKLGGIVSPTATDPMKFGRVVSAAPSDPSVFEVGQPTVESVQNIVRGVSVFDDSIAQNSPAHPDSYLQGLPCAAINHGFFYLGSWTKTATGAIDPTIGCEVIFNQTTGVIEFLASGAAPSGWAVLGNASVRDIDEDNGALIYLN